jgi:hypothetical protein
MVGVWAFVGIGILCIYLLISHLKIKSLIKHLGAVRLDVG